MVRQWQEFFYERRYAATPLLSPDFVKLAEAYGLRGSRASRRAATSCRRSRRRARHKGTTVIDFRVEQEDIGLPDGAGRRRPGRHDPPAEPARRDRDGGCLIETCMTFVVYVEDQPGVLNRVASLFRRRAYNIESLTVGHTERPGISRMTIVVDHRRCSGARRIEANLYKLVNVTAGRDVTVAAGGRPRSGA